MLKQLKINIMERTENHFICNGFVFVTWDYKVIGDTYVLNNAIINKVNDDNTKLTYKRNLDLNEKNEVVLPVNITIKIEWK